MGGGQQRPRVEHERRAEARLARPPHQHHRHPVGKPAVRRGPDERLGRAPAAAPRDEAGRDAGQGDGGACAVHAPKRRPFNRALLGCARARSHCIQTPKRTCWPRFWNRGFVVMAALAIVSRAAVVCLALTGGSRARAAEAEPHAAAAKPVCLNAADTREQVKAHKLLEPYAALKSAAQQRKAEALSAKLCVSGDEFIYEITLLHRDGRLDPRPDGGRDRQARSRGPRTQHETKTRTTRTSSRKSSRPRTEPARKSTRMRLLVVEDDRDLNRQISSALEAAGYAVDRAFDGEEGWFQGDTEPYDAVVLDIGLPKRDGISVLEAWRKAGRTMPVLILTARDRWSDKVQGIDAGADDYVAKPFHMEEVLARLRALLRRAAGHASSDLAGRPGAARRARRPRHGQRPAGEAHQPRVPAPVLSHAPRRAHHLAHRDRRAPLRAGFRPRFEYDRGVHRPPAQEARRRHHQDRARPRLSRRRRRTAAPRRRAYRPTHCWRASRRAGSAIARFARGWQPPETPTARSNDRERISFFRAATNRRARRL